MCSIETDPENLVAINTLAGMGILTDDDSLVDAALSEILALPLDDRLNKDPGRDVTYLLIQHHLAQVRRSICLGLLDADVSCRATLREHYPSRRRLYSRNLHAPRSGRHWRS